MDRHEQDKLQVPRGAVGSSLSLDPRRKHATARVARIPPFKQHANDRGSFRFDSHFQVASTGWVLFANSEEMHETSKSISSSVPSMFWPSNHRGCVGTVRVTPRHVLVSMARLVVSRTSNGDGVIFIQGSVGGPLPLRRRGIPIATQV